MDSYSSPLLDDYNRTGQISAPLQKALDIVRTKLAPGVPAPSLPSSSPAGGEMLGERRDFAPSAQPGFQYAATSEQLGRARDQSTPAPMRVLGQDVTPSQPQMRVLGQPIEAQPSMASATPAHDQLMDRVLGQTPNPGTRPLSPAAQAHQAELDRLTTGETGKSGIDAISHQWLKQPLRVLDAVASAFAPRLERALPGTMGHHEFLLGQARRAVDEDEKLAQGAAQREHLQAESSELGQRGQEEAARAQALANPTEKEEAAGKTITTDQGIFQWNPETKRYDIKAGNAATKEQGTVHQLADGSLVIAHPDGTATAVTMNGQPIKGKTTEQKTPQLTAIERGYIRAAGGNPDDESTWSPDVMKKFRDLSTQRAPSVNVNAETSALDREVSHFGAPHQKSLEAAQGQIDKIHEAREMINGNAAAQALGIPKVLTAVVSGQGSGVRVTNAELNRVGKARGLQGDVEGTIRKWEGKGELTPEQQRQLSGVLDDVEKLVTQKMGIVNDALDKMNGARSRDEIVAADKEARKRISDLENGKQAGSPSAGKHGTYNPRTGKVEY